jgi:hypothetical protein
MDQLKELPGKRFPSMACRCVYRRDPVREHFSDFRVGVFDNRPSFESLAMSKKIRCSGVVSWYQSPILFSLSPKV